MYSWLIAEDALRNRVGHWYEYLRTVRNGLQQLGDKVEVLADEAAEEFIVQGISAEPVLPHSIWHRMSDSSSVLTRYSRVVTHAWATRSRISKWLAAHPPYDIVFVPTVLVHHLLAWLSLARGPLRRQHTRILLFFLHAPITVSADGSVAWDRSPTSWLFRNLIRALSVEVSNGRVLLGVETTAMRDALFALTGVPFVYFPQPALPLALTPESEPLSAPLVVGAYGGSRREKGDDLLIAAIKQYNRSFPGSRVVFHCHSVGGDLHEWMALRSAPNVHLITDYTTTSEYENCLRHTNVLILPYRLSSYALRGSRVAVEGMVNGIPMIATRHSTYAHLASRYGAAVLCDDGNVDSLVGAIRQCETDYCSLQQLAIQNSIAAREHFSVSAFRAVATAIQTRSGWNDDT